MTEHVVTETPDDWKASPPLWIGEATDAMAALDAFAEQEGFAPYSEIVKLDEHKGMVDVDEHGRTWAIFTNTTVYAVPVQP